MMLENSKLHYYDLSVIVPAFNESSTIGIVLRRLSYIENIKEVIKATAEDAL